MNNAAVAIWPDTRCSGRGWDDTFLRAPMPTRTVNGACLAFRLFASRVYAKDV